MEDKSVLTLKEYGSVVFHVKELMDAKSITRGALSRLAHIRYEVATKWYEGKVERIDIDVLARICWVLECQIEDLITYEK